MAEYAYFEDGGMREVHDQLPANWRHVSGLNLLVNDIPTLNSLGWYTVEKVPPSIDPSAQRVTGYTYSIVDGKALETPVIADIPAWEIANNTPPAPPTAEQLFQEQVEAYKVAVQGWLDKAAFEKGYDNILSACSYAAIENAFQAEGIAFLQWRSSVWITCYAMLNDVTTGARSAPELDALLSELPALVLP